MLRMKTKPEKVPRISSLIDMFCLCRCVGKKSAENATSLPLSSSAATAAVNKHKLPGAAANGLHHGGLFCQGAGGRAAAVVQRPPLRRAISMAEGGLGGALSAVHGGDIQLYACDICGQEGLNEDDMRSHVLIEHVEGAISCPFCDLEGTTVEEMNMHVNSEHLDFLTPTRDLDDVEITEMDDDDDGGGKRAAERRRILHQGAVGRSVSCVSDLQNCNGGFVHEENENNSGGTGSSSSDCCAVRNTHSSESVSALSGLSSPRSSDDTTPEGGGLSGYSDQPLTPPPVPMEITITAADSPKRCVTQQNNNPAATTADHQVQADNSTANSADSAVALSSNSDTSGGSCTNACSNLELNAAAGVAKTKAGSPPDGEEQLRKRAKLYLDVPPVVRPQQQQQQQQQQNTQQQQHVCKNHQQQSANGYTGRQCSNMESLSAATRGALAMPAVDNANEGEAGMIVEEDGEEKKDREKPYPGDEQSKGTGNSCTTNKTGSNLPRTPPREKLESPLRCPLCDWMTKSPGEIMRHVNAEHLDILSPLSAKARANNHIAQQHHQQQQQQLNQQQQQQRTDTENNVIAGNCDPLIRPSTSCYDNTTAAITARRAGSNARTPTSPRGEFECPICGHTSRSGSALELHVNSRHADILSPQTGGPGGGGGGNVGVPHSSSSHNGVGGGGNGGGLSQLQSPMSIGSSTDSSMCCPVCGMEFVDQHDLAIHVDGHFSAEHTPVTEQMDNLLAQELERRERAAYKMQEQREFEKLQELYGMNGKSNYRKQAERNLERAVCHGQMSISDYYTRKQEIQQASVAGVDDGHSCTGNIIGRLKQYYKTTQSNVGTAWLCSGCDHFAASYGDKGWGCGYRNLQMLLSCLAANPTFEKILFNVEVNEGGPMIPSIPKIQRLIEAAWQKGFDLQGSEQLGGKVVDTTKWIGATEIVATLSSLKVKCQLIDFHAPTGKDGTHPRLFEWVRDYFKKDTDFKSPLYLQHQGHSRTIVGIEQLKDGQLRLLLFDPSCNRKQMHQFVHGDITANLMRCLRRSLHSMKAKQYQIVAVTGILSDHEYEESKIMKSDRIP